MLTIDTSEALQAFLDDPEGAQSNTNNGVDPYAFDLDEDDYSASMADERCTAISINGELLTNFEQLVELVTGIKDHGITSLTLHAVEPEFASVLVREAWTLKDITILTTTFTAESMRKLAAQISQSEYLTSVDLSHNELNDDLGQILFAKLKNSNVQELNLESNNLTDNLGDALATCLSSNPQLNNIYLDHNPQATNKLLVNAIPKLTANTVVKVHGLVSHTAHGNFSHATALSDAIIASGKWLNIDFGAVYSKVKFPFTEILRIINANTPVRHLKYPHRIALTEMQQFNQTVSASAYPHLKSVTFPFTKELVGNQNAAMTMALLKHLHDVDVSFARPMPMLSMEYLQALNDQPVANNSFLVPPKAFTLRGA